MVEVAALGYLNPSNAVYERIFSGKGMMQDGLFRSKIPGIDMASGLSSLCKLEVTRALAT